MTREPLPVRVEFPVRRPVQTRWMDNDHYGHVNNVAYYSFFDTAVNGFLIEATGRDIRTDQAIGVVAETSCRFLAEISFPDALEVGLAIERLGTRSVVYRLAIFRVFSVDGRAEPCAIGRFVHVYVDRDTRQPVAIPGDIRAVLAPLAALTSGEAR